MRSRRAQSATADKASASSSSSSSSITPSGPSPALTSDLLSNAAAVAAAAVAASSYGAAKSLPSSSSTAPTSSSTTSSSNVRSVTIQEARSNTNTTAKTTANVEDDEDDGSVDLGDKSEVEVSSIPSARKDATTATAAATAAAVAAANASITATTATTANAAKSGTTSSSSAAAATNNPKPTSNLSANFGQYAAATLAAAAVASAARSNTSPLQHIAQGRYNCPQEYLIHLCQSVEDRLLASLKQIHHVNQGMQCMWANLLSKHNMHVAAKGILANKSFKRQQKQYENMTSLLHSYGLGQGLSSLLFNPAAVMTSGDIQENLTKVQKQQMTALQAAWMRPKKRKKEADGNETEPESKRNDEDVHPDTEVTPEQIAAHREEVSHNRTHAWTDEERLLLVHFRIRQLISRSTRGRIVTKESERYSWDKTALLLKLKHGIMVSGKQAKNQWNSIRRAYIEWQKTCDLDPSMSDLPVSEWMRYLHNNIGVLSAEDVLQESRPRESREPVSGDETEGTRKKRRLAGAALASHKARLERLKTISPAAYEAAAAAFAHRYGAIDDEIDGAASSAASTGSRRSTSSKSNKKAANSTQTAAKKKRIRKPKAATAASTEKKAPARQRSRSRERSASERDTSEADSSSSSSSSSSEDDSRRSDSSDDRSSDDSD